MFSEPSCVWCNKNQVIINRWTSLYLMKQRMWPTEVSAISYKGQSKKSQRWLQGHEYGKKITRSGNNQKFYWGLSAGERKARECDN